MFPDEISLQLLHRPHAERDAAGPEIAAIDTVACLFVERIALTLGPFARDAQIHPVIGDRQIDHGFEAAGFVTADVAGNHRFELVGRLGRDQVHDTSGRIAAIESALRAAQDFDLSHVEEFLFEEVIADEWRVVEGYRNGRISGDRDGLRADSANLNAVTREVRLGEGQVRDLLHKIRAAGGLSGSQLLLAHRRDSDWNRLNVRTAEL